LSFPRRRESIALDNIHFTVRKWIPAYAGRTLILLVIMDLGTIESKNTLQNSLQNFISATSFTPVIGAEVEFYLIGTIPENIIEIISARCSGLEIFDVKKEEGKGQYEVSLLHLKDAVLLADRVLKLRSIIEEISVELKIKANFSAKPFADDYGNSLHIHVSLLDENGKNPFEKQGDSESESMLYAIGGLLAKMPESMPHFAPYKACYTRLAGGMDAPSTLSWGGNNRTVALRLPTTTGDPENRRIEHRVSTADADPYAVITAILDGISYGILNKILPQSEKIYGNAALPVYGLKKITNSMESS
jgi:glutamine synthetase